MTDSEIVNLYWQRSERAIAETDCKYGRYCHHSPPFWGGSHVILPSISMKGGRGRSEAAGKLRLPWRNWKNASPQMLIRPGKWNCRSSEER